MRPLLFVNWRSVQARFCVLMWLLVGVLTIVVLAHTGGGVGASAHHTMVTARR